MIDEAETMWGKHLLRMFLNLPSLGLVIGIISGLLLNRSMIG
jgi:hypothetical protein